MRRRKIPIDRAITLDDLQIINYIETLLNQQGRSIEVINTAADGKEDLLQDFIAIITSFCARLYGQRRSKR